MSSPSIEVADRGTVRILTINNPAKRNAFSGSMAPTLRKLLKSADRDPAVRSIVVTGAGQESFSSGHDLEEVLKNPGAASDTELNSAFTLPSQIGTPVIGAVNGYAYAAGFILALNCDLRVAGDCASFCAVGARIGLVPVGGQLSRLLHIVTYPVAFKMVATANPLGAEEAVRVGFATETCPADQTVDRAVELAEEIAATSPSVVRAAKTGFAVTLREGMDAGEDLEAKLAAVVWELPDGEEGVRSFLEKRLPVYPSCPVDLQSRFDEARSRDEY